jgi:hypothetical protein
MNYAEIKAATIGSSSYSNREDQDFIDNFDNMLKVVEARINRFLKTIEMTARATIVTTSGQEYYALPTDFNGMIDLEVKTSLSDSNRYTAMYVAPEVLNSMSTQGITSSGKAYYFSIVDNQLQILPATDLYVIEAIYYVKLTPLTDIANNFIADYNPDTYIYGLLTEINAISKDYESSKGFEDRFKESLNEIRVNDVRKIRGTNMQIQLG